MNTPFPPTIFLTSVAKLEQLPIDKGAEIAFIGRSNSGKSTALNTITGKKGLAKTSKTPGRTQLLNFFKITDQHRLVDLPGYGYANIPTYKKQEWEKAITSYLKTRLSLKGLIITMDIRHPLKKLDQTMLTWALHYQIPVYILLTKADKLTHHQAKNTLIQVNQQLTSLNLSCGVHIFSAKSLMGVKTTRQIILGLLDI